MYFCSCIFDIDIHYKVSRGGELWLEGAIAPAPPKLNLITYTHTHSHRDAGKFKRIPVFMGPNGGFGFAAPYEFDTLGTLVLYYASNTMEKHNADLETNLKFPAFAET